VTCCCEYSQMKRSGVRPEEREIMATCGTVTTAKRIELHGVSQNPRNAERRVAAAGRVSRCCRVTVQGSLCGSSCRVALVVRLVVASSVVVSSRVSHGCGCHDLG